MNLKSNWESSAWITDQHSVTHESVFYTAGSINYHTSRYGYNLFGALTQRVISQLSGGFGLILLS